MADTGKEHEGDVTPHEGIDPADDKKPPAAVPEEVLNKIRSDEKKKHQRKIDDQQKQLDDLQAQLRAKEDAEAEAKRKVEELKEASKKDKDALAERLVTAEDTASKAKRAAEDLAERIALKEQEADLAAYRQKLLADKKIKRFAALVRGGSVDELDAAAEQAAAEEARVNEEVEALVKTKLGDEVPVPLNPATGGPRVPTSPITVEERAALVRTRDKAAFQERKSQLLDEAYKKAGLKRGEPLVPGQ